MPGGALGRSGRRDLGQSGGRRPWCLRGTRRCRGTCPATIVGEPLGDVDLERPGVERVEHRLDHRVDRERLDARPSTASLSGRWNSSVSITPGFTTWTPHVGPSTRGRPASTPTTPVSAAFDAAYAASAGGPSRAATDEMFTMRPAALDQLGQQREREPDRREVVDRHHRLDDLGRRAPCTVRRFGMPALFTSTSMPPSSSLASRGERLDAVEVGEVDGPRSATRASAPARARAPRRARSSRRAQMPTVAPRCREPLGERGADARRRAGDSTCLPATE